jgi:hypothetical protein
LTLARKVIMNVFRAITRIVVGTGTGGILVDGSGFVESFGSG